jgi:uncharacterized protein (TIGR03435 family)
MLRNLLADRFQLSYHFKQKQLDEYSLVTGKGGPKVTVSPAQSVPDNDLSLAPVVPKKDTWYGIAAPIIKGEISYRRDFAGTVYLASTGATIDQFAAVAKVFLAGVPVVDATELKGRYDFQLSIHGPVGLAGGGPNCAVRDAGAAASSAASRDFDMAIFSDWRAFPRGRAALSTGRAWRPVRWR